MSVHIFGIRHHGPGSARSLCQALATLQPDIVLVEGPPDAAAGLPLLMHQRMRPPVALLIYVPENPQQAVYYPFAVFSPEWQALRYGLTQNIPVRFMDLPQSHRFALTAAPSGASDEADEQTQETPPSESELPIEPSTESPTEPSTESPIESQIEYRTDPLNLLARAAGYSDGERWWEHLVEQRQDSSELFAAILTAMTVLRTEVEQADALQTSALSSSSPSLESYREAYMRQTIRAAEKEGFQTIAVVCGAWHAPALTQMPSAKTDTDLLKGLPKVKVEATWIPWTYGHLLISSGYGAGIESPGWYHHLWEQGEQHQKQKRYAIQRSAATV